jgi:DNA-directed RNA polymerase subunit RPC12/RpoP
MPAQHKDGLKNNRVFCSQCGANLAAKGAWRSENYKQNPVSKISEGRDTTCQDCWSILKKKRSRLRNRLRARSF